MKEERKKLSGAEKVGLIRRHLVEGEEVSKVCEEGGISPRQFYRWQQELFEGGAEVLDGQRGRSNYYNNERLHSAIGYVTPRDKCEGREVEIFASRDSKLETARAARKAKRHQAANFLSQDTGFEAAAMLC